MVIPKMEKKKLGLGKKRIERLESYAEERGLNNSEAARRLIDDGFKHQNDWFRELLFITIALGFLASFEIPLIRFFIIGLLLILMYALSRSVVVNEWIEGLLQ